MTDQSQWQRYVEAAIDEAGGPTALARQAGLDVGTIHRWRRGANAGRATNVQKLARARGDDPANALRAAGLATRAPAHDSGSPPAGPVAPLDIEIARIRGIGERLGLPPDVTLRAIQQLIDAYAQLPGPGGDNGHGTHRQPA